MWVTAGGCGGWWGEAYVAVWRVRRYGALSYVARGRCFSVALGPVAGITLPGAAEGGGGTAGRP